MSYDASKYGSFITLIVSCTNTTITPSNSNFILSVDMGVYSSSSKFQTDCIYESRDIIIIMLFLYISYVKGQPLTLHIENVWEMHFLKCCIS